MKDNLLPDYVIKTSRPTGVDGAVAPTIGSIEISHTGDGDQLKIQVKVKDVSISLQPKGKFRRTLIFIHSLKNCLLQSTERYMSRILLSYNSRKSA